MIAPSAHSTDPFTPGLCPVCGAARGLGPCPRCSARAQAERRAAPQIDLTTGQTAVACFLVDTRTGEICPGTIHYRGGRVRCPVCRWELWLRADEARAFLEGLLHNRHFAGAVFLRCALARRQSLALPTNMLLPVGGKQVRKTRIVPEPDEDQTPGAREARLTEQAAINGVRIFRDNAGRLWASSGRSTPDGEPVAIYRLWQDAAGVWVCGCPAAGFCSHLGAREAWAAETAAAAEPVLGAGKRRDVQTAGREAVTLLFG